MLYICFPLSLHNAEDLPHEHGIDICHQTVWFWWNRIGPKPPSSQHECFRILFSYNSMT
jgi:transposase-like protein